MDANFNTLLNRYIENQATPAEERELYRLMQDASHRWLMEQSFDSVYKEESRKDVVETPLTPQESAEERAKLLRKSHPGSARRRIIMMATTLIAAAACLMVVMRRF